MARRGALRGREKEVVARYVAGEKNLGALATAYGVTREAVLYHVQKAGVYEGDHRAGRHIHQAGYVVVAIPRGDPLRSMTRNGQVLEHRLVMARFLGRPLLSSEQVHHRNGDKQDNRIENLQLVSGPHGVGQCYACGDCGSLNIIPQDIDYQEDLIP